MALSQETAQSLADAYGSGDIAKVNQIIGSQNVGSQDVASFWNFTPEQMAELGSKGVSFAQPAQTTANTSSSAPLSQVQQSESDSAAPAASGALPAQSAGYLSATGTGGIGLDQYNQNINNWFADKSHTLADTLAAMQQYGVSAADIQAATGKSLDSFFPTNTTSANTQTSVGEIGRAHV